MEQTTESQILSPAVRPYPVSVHIPRQERYSRWLALATLLLMFPKYIMLIPHLVILYILLFLSLFGGILAQIAVLISGHYPKSLFNLVSGTIRWQTRMTAYLYGLTDKYPPFHLS